MRPDTFQILADHIRLFPDLQPAGPGRREPVSVEKQLLMTLWYVGGNDVVRRIADRFGVSESTMVVCRDKIISVLLKLKEKLIRWPKPQELQQEVQEFARRNGFPGIVGAIDGTHIGIKAPREYPERYFNRKQFYSIQLQGVCKTNRQFTHVFVGYPGSVHDSRVLRTSDLWHTGLAKCNNVYHLLGDGGYPLRKWLLTPYRDNGHLNRQQRRYNYYHSANRMVIERAFQLLKSRFRRLHLIDTASVETAVHIAMACCVLHNWCIQHNDLLDVDDDDSSDEDEDDNDNTADGVLERDRIARLLV